MTDATGTENATRMDQNVKSKWLAALRAGDIRQGKCYLRTRVGSMCCIGVLAHVQGVKLEEWSCDELATSKLPKDLAAGLDVNSMCDLAHKNDGGQTFAQIADWIEKNL